MHLRRTEAFDLDAARYQLQFTCDDCGFFDPDREQCRHRWPTKVHRLSVYRAPLREGDEVVFCKEFEVR